MARIITEEEYKKQKEDKAKGKNKALKACLIISIIINFLLILTVCVVTLYYEDQINFYKNQIVDFE